MLPIKWSAPEVLKFNKTSSKSDVWSFGITLWELFSYGEVPYRGMSNKEVSEQVIAGYRLEMPPGCPPEIWNLMKICWAENPKDRPTFSEINEDLEKLCTEIETGYHSVNPTQIHYNQTEEEEPMYHW